MRDTRRSASFVGGGWALLLCLAPVAFGGQGLPQAGGAGGAGAKAKPDGSKHGSAVHNARDSASTLHKRLPSKGKPVTKAAKSPAVVRAAGANQSVVMPSPDETAALKADNEGVLKITGYMKVGDLDSALAECKSAIDASAAASGGVAMPRLRHLLGSIYLAAGRYADAYRIFEDIGRHNGEMYVFSDFDMDVALAAVHVGNPRHAEFLVRRYLSRFGPNGFEGRTDLLPGFATPTAAVATVHAVRGANFLFTGREEEARVELNLAAQIAPYNAYIALLRGMALNFTGHYEQARACLEVAGLSDDPDVRIAAQGAMQNVRNAEAKRKAESEKAAAAGK